MYGVIPVGPFDRQKWQTSLPYQILQLIIMRSPPFMYLKPKEGTPFGQSLPVGHYRDYPPPGRNQSPLIVNVSVTGFDVYLSVLLCVQSRRFYSKFCFPKLSVSYL